LRFNAKVKKAIDLNKSLMYSGTMKLLLNTKKIQKELERQGKTKAWLARQLGISRQNLHYILTARPVSKTVRMAEVFEFEPKDLITYE
jgi:hypothetical protein